MPFYCGYLRIQFIVECESEQVEYKTLMNKFTKIYYEGPNFNLSIIYVVFQNVCN